MLGPQAAIHAGQRAPFSSPDISYRSTAKAGKADCWGIIPFPLINRTIVTCSFAP